MARLFLIFEVRMLPFVMAITLSIAFAILVALHPHTAWLWIGLAVAGFFLLVGLHDVSQTHHSALRIYPIAPHLRFILESIRPEMRQYFFEDEKHGLPFSRDKRSIVYQRAKMALDMVPFGTSYNVYEPGFEWVNHWMQPAPLGKEPYRITIGGPQCSRPYSA